MTFDIGGAETHKLYFLQRAAEESRRPPLGDITPLVQSWLGQWAALLSNIPDGVMLAALLLPIALAVFSKRLIVLLGCILLAATFFSALIAPSNVAVTLATGVYLGSVILAASGVVSRRKAKVYQAYLFARRRQTAVRGREPAIGRPAKTPSGGTEISQEKSG